MLRLFIRMGLTLTVISMLASCTPQETNSSPSYKEMKTMVVDILESEEAQKSIQNAQQKGAYGMQMLTEADLFQVDLAVKQYLTSQDQDKMMRKLITDPKFAGDFAKSIEQQMKDLHKDLMKDPEYQTSLIKVLKNKQFEEMVQEQIQSPEYRKHTMTIMQEAVQSPLFRVELMDLLKKVIEEETKPETAKKENNGDGDGSSNGGKGGGQGGQ
jgi:spore germination protein D